MRDAFDSQDRDHSEEITLSAAMRLLMRDELDWRKRNEEKWPDCADKITVAARRGLNELLDATPDSEAKTARDLRTFKAVSPRLAAIDSTAKGLGMLIELSAFQPWAACKKPRALEKKPRASLLEKTALLLGGDTEPEDVEAIDKIIYRKTALQRYWKLGVIVVAGGLGVATAGMAAPAIGGAIGATMGLSGAAAVNAGLAALGGGAISAGGLGVAGGTALIGGMGGLAGTGASAASLRFLKSEDVSSQMVDLEARKLEALHDRLRHHGQSTQAYAQQVVVGLREQIAVLEADAEALRQKAANRDKEIKDLKKKIKILSQALERMLKDE